MVLLCSLLNPFLGKPTYKIACLRQMTSISITAALTRSLFSNSILVRPYSFSSTVQFHPPPLSISGYLLFFFFFSLCAPFLPPEAGSCYVAPADI
jgi:hypothetical protein